MRIRYGISFLLTFFFSASHIFSQPPDQDFTGTATGNVSAEGVPQNSLIVNGLLFTVVQPSSLGYQLGWGTDPAYMCIQNSSEGTFYGNADPGRGNYLCLNQNMDGFEGGVTTLDGMGGDYGAGPTDLRIASEDGAAFRFVSMYVDCSYTEVDNDFILHPTTIKGFRDNVEVASVEIPSFNTDGPHGAGNNIVAYTKVPLYDGGAGTLTFTGTNWHNIDEMRITNDVSLVLALDNMQFDVNSTLPLTWKSFTGSLHNETVLLEWITSDAYNTEFFVVERSTDGSRFTAVGTLPSYNTTGDKKYTFTDMATEKGVDYYYRIRQTDIDGRFSLSKIVKINTGSGNIKELRVKNNPFRETLDFIYPSEHASTLAVKLVSTAGQVIFARPMAIQQGANHISLPVPSIPGGIYFLQVVKNGQQFQQVKVVKR